MSGTIVKAEEHGFHYYAREALKPEVTFADYKVTSNEETVESQVASARDERDRVALWGRILPITFTALGLLALVGGVLLGSFTPARGVGADRPGPRRRRPRLLRSTRDGGLRPDARRRGEDRETAHAAAVRPAAGQTGLIRPIRRSPPRVAPLLPAGGRCPRTRWH